MPDKSDPRPGPRLLRLLCACAFASLCFALEARAAGGPVLLSEAGSTRAVALESVTLKRDPFPVTSPLAWSDDRRTRVMLFVLNLELLPGEGTNALTSDAQDASGRLYQLKVEHVSRVPGQEWMHAVVLRLDDGMTDALGDVLVRVSLHGMSSNRVRVAVGRAGGGPPDDPGSTPTAAPPTPPNATPTPLPAYGPNEASEADTTRFLEQASWGPTPAEIARVRALGLRAYLNEQFNATPSGYPLMPLYPQDNAQGCPSAVLNDPAYHRNVCIRQNYSMYPLQVQFFKNALYGQDQLRQRVAFALHQILVVSGRDPINQASWLGPYVQILERHAFGNYRQLLREVTLNPAMGLYLDTLGNTRTNPNENFAREILQLFSVGVDELNPDGTPRLDAQGNRVPTYTQETVNNFTRVFTGWTLAAPRTATIDGVSFSVLNFRDPMVAREQNHDTGAKTLLSYPNAPSFNLPPGQTASADLDAALNNIFNHPNVGPFVGRQLIQHLVTGNPSPAYVGRVAAVFNNNCAGLYPESCTGERGDLKATVRAVLLDPEARGDVKTDPSYGRLRDPAQFVNAFLRAFDAKSLDRTTQSDGFHSDTTSSLDQDIFRPPTVFSYYPPDHEVPGTKLLGPAFAIHSTSTTLRRTNWVNTMVYTGITRSTPTGTPPAVDPGSRPLGTALDLSAWLALAPQPAQLVAELDRVLLHGTMPAAMRASVVKAVEAMPASNPMTVPESVKRAQTAVYLVATSPQYQVQR